MRDNSIPLPLIRFNMDILIVYDTPRKCVSCSRGLLLWL